MAVDVYRSALWYARRGWYVVPLHNPLFDRDGYCTGCTCEAWKRKQKPDYVCETQGKHPRLSDWETNATTDPQIIASWWRRWPDANVGIAAGRSGLLCFDVDSYKDRYAGDHLLTSSDEQTVTNLTGSGGSHLLYAMPEDANYGNSTGQLPAGIDIRGYGGQFVAPPSLHPSGNRYQWELGYGPHEIDPRGLPTHIAAILDTHTAQLDDTHFTDAPTTRPDLGQWRLSKRIWTLIQHTSEPGKRSEADQAVITALIMAGAAEDDIRAVFEHYPIGTEGKFDEKGDNALRYLAHSISRSRVWCERQREQETEKRAAAFIAMATR